MNYFCDNFAFMKKANNQVSAILKYLSDVDNCHITWAFAGSNAMFLHGVPLTRKLHDIDIILPSRLQNAFSIKDPCLLRITARYYCRGYITASYRLEAINCPPIDVMFILDEEYEKSVEYCFHPCGYGRVASLNNILEVKRLWSRPKDIKDIDLITGYLQLIAD